jgi:general stress protein 26
MTQASLDDIAEKMSGIDIAMFSTKTADGTLATRPMSNNGDVSYDGTSYYFANGDARLVTDIETNDTVALGFAGKPGLLSSAAYIAVAGRASLVRDKAAFEEHWSPDLDAWFEDGVDTPGLVMVKVVAQRIKYWDRGEEAELLL